MKNKFRTLIIAVLCLALIAGMIITSQASDALTVPTGLASTEYRFQATDATFDGEGNATFTVRLACNSAFTPGSVTVNIQYPADSGVSASNFTTPSASEGFAQREINAANHLFKDVMNLTSILSSIHTVGDTSYFDFVYHVSGYDEAKGNLNLSIDSDDNVIGMYNGEETEPTPIVGTEITLSVPGAQQPAPTITNATTLPSATVGTEYNTALAPEGTYTPKDSGKGLSIDANGNIVGTPTEAGDIVFENVTVTTPNGTSDPVTITVHVNAPANPATLLGSNPVVTKNIKDADGETPVGLTPVTFSFTLEAVDDAPMPDTTAFTITTASTDQNNDIDFTTASYQQPGKYYYKLSETVGTDDTFQYDTTKYYIEVSVARNTQNTLEVRGVVATTEMNADQTALQGTKVTGLVFNNTYNNPESNLVNIVLSKTVTGDMGNTMLDFTFAITLTDANDAPLSDDINYVGGKTGTIKNGSGTITLRHGQSITLKSVPKGTKYSIVETPVSGYTQTNTINGETQEIGTTAAGTLSELTTVAFVNDAQYAPPTGISMTGMLPFAGIAILCLGAAVLLIVRKRSTVR